MYNSSVFILTSLRLNWKFCNIRYVVFFKTTTIIIIIITIISKKTDKRWKQSHNNSRVGPRLQQSKYIKKKVGGILIPSV